MQGKSRYGLPVEARNDVPALRDFIRQHQVCWSSRPLAVRHRQEPIQVGYELELKAVHCANHPPIHPGCQECSNLYRGLKRLADAVLPPPGRPTGYEIGPVDFAWHYNPFRGSKPEVVLKIRISHREGFFAPIDDCEKRCLTEMTQALRQLGACSGRWRRQASNSSASATSPHSGGPS